MEIDFSKVVGTMYIVVFCVLCVGLTLLLGPLDTAERSPVQ